MNARDYLYRLVPHKASIVEQDRLDSKIMKDELLVALSLIYNGKYLGI